jgi:hypothetical protein
MRRRSFLAASAVATVQGEPTLKFIPHGDVAVRNPIWTTADGFVLFWSVREA